MTRTALIRFRMAGEPPGMVNSVIASLILAPSFVSVSVAARIRIQTHISGRGT